MRQNVRIKGRVLAAGLLMIFGYGLVSNTLGFFTVPVSQALGCSRSAFTFYYTIASVVSLITAPIFGQLLQRCNARGLILLGAVVGGGAFGVLPLCRTVAHLYLAALLLGLVYQGASNMAAIVLVSRAFGERAGLATGVIMSGTGICSAVMSFVLPTMIQETGWRSAYWLEAALWLGVMLLAFFLTRNTVETPAGEAHQSQMPEKQQVTLRSVLQTPSFFALFFCFGVQGVATIVVHHIPSYLTELGKSAVESSVVMGVFSVVLIGGKLLLGVLFDRLGAAWSLFLNFLSLALGMWMLAIGGDAMLFPGAALTSFGMASIMVLFPLITRALYGDRSYAAIWGVMSMASTLGTACGSPLWGASYDCFGSYRPALMVMPVVILSNAAVIMLLMAHRGTMHR